MSNLIYLLLFSFFRIHISSKVAQLKILSILSVNGATFYNNIHLQYSQILLELLDYYEENAPIQMEKTRILKHFSPEKSTIPDTQLNLEPIYVQVTSIDMCKRLIKLDLQLLAESIPMDALNMDCLHSVYEPVFLNVLKMLECHSTDLKLDALIFFNSLMQHYNKMAITRFCYTFPNVINNLMLCLEALVGSMQICYEQYEIDDYCLEIINKTIISLLQTMDNYVEVHCKQTLINICTVVLNSNNLKIFAKELRIYFLSLSSKVDLPKNIIDLKNMNSEDIQALTDCYVNNIVISLNNAQDCNSLKDNEFYNETLFVITSLNTCQNANIDAFLLTHYLERCSAAFKILENVYTENIAWSRKHDFGHSKLAIFPEDNILMIFTCLGKIIDTHKCIIMENIDIISSILNIITSVVILSDSNKINKGMIIQLTCLQTEPHFSPDNLGLNEDISVNVIKYLLLMNIILKANKTSTIVSLFMNTLIKNKSIDSYKHVSSTFNDEFVSFLKVVGQFFLNSSMTFDSRPMRKSMEWN